MYQPTEKIWMDGKLIPWDEANVHILTHSLHYGVGAFEGIRYYDCGSKGIAVFRLQDHMRRFSDSSRILAMDIGYSSSETVEACLEVVKANKLKEGYIRPLAFISEKPNIGVWAYDNPCRVAIVTWAWGAYLGEEGVRNGIRTKTSSFTRHHPNIGMTQAKATGQYYNSVLAKLEAVRAGCDEAIMLDPRGFVAEGTGENIFMFREGKVKTPGLGSILPGITRNTIMTLLKDLGIPVSEERITRDELYIADEVFLTGTAAEVTPIREIDDRTVGSGQPGALAKKLKELYTNVVRGKESKYEEWLTFVR